MKRRLPIGVQTFAEIANQKLLYVDKTPLIYQLVTGQKYYFLSRPRRFGKSLLVSTLQAIFEGRKDLFADLWIADQLPWENHPVVHLDFASLGYQAHDLEDKLLWWLEGLCQAHQIDNQGIDLATKFGYFIRQLASKTGKRVVLLIDEYDKPLVDFIDQPALANQNRDILRNLYAPIKSLDAHWRFVFFTGISRFAKTSIFSDLNNLYDISLGSQFASLLGYTQPELEHYFADRLGECAANLGLAPEQLLAQIKQHYNGYSWDGQHQVYNPFSVLNFFEAGGVFRNYWFASGTPTLLVKALTEQFVADLQDVGLGEVALQSYDFQDLPKATPSLLFQAGYLTITESVGGKFFIMNYPNQEVREAMNLLLLNEYTHQGQAESLVYLLRKSLQKPDIQLFITQFKALFASIPYQIFLADREAYYHTIVHLVLRLLGAQVRSEASTNQGRTDAVLEVGQSVFICEFKLAPAQQAISQAKARGYAEPYLGQGKAVYLLGVSLDPEQRNIDHYVFEQIT